MKTEKIRQYFSNLRIIYVAMAIGQLMFMAISAFLVNNQGAFAPDLEVMNYVAVGITATILMIHKKIVDGLNKKAIEKNEIIEKLEAYRSSSIVAWAMIEGSTFFSSIAYLLTGHWVGMVLFGGMMLFYLRLKPTPEKVVEDLELSRDESSQIL